MAGANVKEFTDINFADDVLSANGVTLVDFWAAWCGPCKLIAPIIDEIATDFAGRVQVGKLNVDENRETAMKYGVMSIPTLLVFKNGEQVDKVVGYQSKEQLAELLTKNL